MMIVAKWTVIFFGVFIIAAGILMLFAPSKARSVLRKAGSTNIINYTEISLRMLPGIALVLYAHLSIFPLLLTILGWFILATSFILFFVPRRIHHNYSLTCAEIIKPLYFRFISPLAFAFGAFLIYAVL